MPADTFVRSGKVRDLYAVGDDRLLLVASDRLSAFDVVLPTPIPDKGRVLTGLSRFWFDRTRGHRRQPPARRPTPRDLPDGVVGDPAVPRRPARPDDALPPRRGPAGRVRRPRLPRGLRLEGLPGDTARSAASGCRPACASPSGCRSRSSRRPTKAPQGQHDENIPFERVVELVRRGDRASGCATCALALYAPRRRGLRARPGSSSPTPSSSSASLPSGELILIDEVLTPDSSRFWDAATYAPGRAQASFDKQFVRDWLERQPWDKTAPGPALPGRRRGRHPQPLRRGVRADHRGELRPLPGGGRHRPMSEPHLPVRRQRDPQARHPRPAGPGRRAQPAAPRDRRRVRRPRRAPRRAVGRGGRRGRGARDRRPAGGRAARRTR